MKTLKNKHILFFFAILFLSTPIAKAAITQNNAPGNSLIRNYNGINFSIDYRIELLSIVSALAGDRLTPLNFTYKNDVFQFFQDYKNHKAVNYLHNMRRKGMGLDGPPEMMLYLSNNFDKVQAFPEILIKRAHGSDKLDSVVFLLKQFAEESNYSSFFNSHKKFYNQVLDNMLDEIKGFDEIDALEKYYGKTQKSYNVILVPLVCSDNFGPRVKTSSGKFDIYSIMGLPNLDNDIPYDKGINRFRQLVWHEFSHSFVNPLCDEYKQEIKKYSQLHEPISSHMSNLAYPLWHTIAIEHIVRAVVTRLNFLELGDKDGNTHLAQEMGDRFIYVGELCKALVSYEGQRDKYKSFDEFFPTLLKVFDDIQAQNKAPELLAQINKKHMNMIVNCIEPNNIVFITPSNETDKSIEKNINDFAQNLKQAFFNNALIVKDTEALNQKFIGKTIMVIGTFDGNLWIKNKCKEVPVQVFPDKLIADTTYTGNNLIFMSTWVNPDDPSKNVVIVSAQKAKDIPLADIEEYSSHVNYIIAKKGEELKTGFYKKMNDKWVF